MAAERDAAVKESAYRIDAETRAAKARDVAVAEATALRVALGEALEHYDPDDLGASYEQRERLSLLATATAAAEPTNAQCTAILPNSTVRNDGWLNCSGEAGHDEPHRTCYVGVAACIGDPGWTFDRAAIEALPSAYRTPTASPPVSLAELVRELLGVLAEQRVTAALDLRMQLAEAVRQ